MIRKFAIATTAILGAGFLVAPLSGAVAAIGTGSNTVVRHGIAVSTPKKVTAPSGGKATIKAVLRVESGQHRAVRSYRIDAYRGSKRVSHGKSVHLDAGTYKVQVSVTYRNWKYVVKSSVATGTGGADYAYAGVEHATRSKVKVYGADKHFTTPRQTLVVASKAKPVTHACTRTPSGACSKGGQFCKEALYGDSGWDASGAGYVCAGSRSHPHWE